MVDIFTKEKRSEIMSRIRSKSGLDRRVHNWLCGAHIRHKMYPKIEGNPDIRITRGPCIFNDSCFWHRCPIHYREPKSSFSGVDWHEKIKRNVERDNKRKSLPYRWLRIWEHDINSGAFKGIILRSLE